MIIDLFSGAGGWDEGARHLGIHPIGIELDPLACRTARAAGHRTIRADVTTFPLERLAGKVTGLIASPPCTDFSRAGKRAGLQGDTGRLVWEVMRWAKALRPEWIACEQVPDVLGVWRLFAHELRGMGYSAWAGVLNAADYGVPQTRERAILMASRTRPATPPEPTHCRGGADAGLFGETREPWVSMADALGWFEPAAWKTSRGRGLLERHGARRDKPVEETAPTVSTKARSAEWVVRTGNNSMVTGRTGSRDGVGDVQRYECSVTKPAPTLDTNVGSKWALRPAPTIVGSRRSKDGGIIGRQLPPGQGENVGGWGWERPATTVQGDPRVGRPGHKDRDKGEAQFGQDSVRVSVQEAAILQSFPPDYPWQGTKTAQFRQVGNAIPPQLARRILDALITEVATQDEGAA